MTEGIEGQGATVRLPKTENRITTGNWITIAAFIVAGAVTWGSVTGKLDALAQRVDKGEDRDRKTDESVQNIEKKLIEIQAEQKTITKDSDRQGKQLDRIERALENVAKIPGKPTP